MRKRHMVDISDYAWDKLEKLASRLDAQQFVYKGRPRYGKLIELAIEKLEDSTMEWTVEEVRVDGNGNDATGELESILLDDGPLPIDEYYMQAAQDMALYGNSYIGTDYAKESDFPAISKPIKAKVSADTHGVDKTLQDIAESLKQQEQEAQGFFDPDPTTIHEASVWTVPFTTKAGTFITLKARTDKQWTEEQTTLIQNAVYKVVAGSATFYSPFHVSFVGGTGFYEYAAVLDVNPKLAKWTEEKAKKALKAILVEKGLSGTKQLKPIDKVKAEYDAKKPIPPVPLVMYKMSEPGYIELSGTLTQALSAPQYDTLRGFAYAAFAEFSSDKGGSALSVNVKKMPWNKLWISATYADPSKLLKKLPDIGEAVAKRVEAWLLQGNFIGLLPQAVDITEKKPSTHPKYHVSWSFKSENKLDKNGTMQLRDVHAFVVSQGFVLENSKFEISERIKDEVSVQYGYGSTKYISSGVPIELTWSLDGKSLLIKVSVKRKNDTPAMFSVQKVGDAVIAYLSKMLDTYYTL